MALNAASYQDRRVPAPDLSAYEQTAADKIPPGGYETWSGNEKYLPNLYQFARNETRVAEDFVKNGFELVARSKFAGVKGFKSEIEFGRDWLQAIYRRGTVTAKITKGMMALLFRPFAFHMALLVLKKGPGEPVS